MDDKQTGPDPEKLIQRYTRAKERRAPWEGHWRECYEFSLPQRDAVIAGASPGAKKGTRLYDATATDAVDQLAASLLSELTPPWGRWFDFKPGREAPEESHDAMADVLGHSAAVLQGQFDRSNFAVEMHQCYLDLVTAGTACLMFEEAPIGETSAFRFSAVPLAEVVSFADRQGFNRINREEGKTVVSVRADTDTTIVQGAEVIERLQADHMDAIASKHGVEYSFGGTQAEQNAAFGDLQLGGLIALGIMYVIISWIFASYFAPLAVMLIIPFGVVGAIWGHYIMGYSLTIISMMGLLGLAGILVNDSIVFVSRLQERVQEGDSLEKAATGAARDRLRAVLLTSLTTIGGLTPLLFETSLQAQFLIPMAITIVFGLGLATTLVLFLVPAFIGIGADIGAFFGWLFLRKGAPTFRGMLRGDHHTVPRGPELEG